MRTLVLTLAGFFLLISPCIAQEESTKGQTETAKQEVKGDTSQDDDSDAKKISAPPVKPETAPATFKVKFETSQGNFVVEVTRKWAPLGADQFYNLIKTGYYDDTRFFRVLPNFVVQWGLSGNPKATANWKKPIKDDPVVESNKKGYITYAKSTVDSRTTQLFINLKDNERLDDMGFPPFGRVIEGFPVLNKLYSGYGGRVSNQQSRIKQGGNEFLNKNYPKLDYIKKATLVLPDKPKDDDGEAEEAAADPAAKQ